MSTTYISVIVTNSQGKAQSGVKVSTVSQQTTTDGDGRAVVSAQLSNIAIFVDGRTVYDGFASSCPNPLFCIV